MLVRLGYRYRSAGQVHFGYISSHQAGRSFLVPKPGMNIDIQDPEGLQGRFRITGLEGPTQSGTAISYVLDVEATSESRVNLPVWQG